MARVNERNNNPATFPSPDETISTLLAKCRELTWPFLRNSTIKSYGHYFDDEIVPKWGNVKLRKLTTVSLQEWFSSYHPRLAPKTIRSMHGALRATLNQAVIWGMLDRNPAVGIKSSRKKARKPPVLLELPQIRAMLENVPEPTRSVIFLIVFGSTRVGEVLALRWKRIEMVGERGFEPPTPWSRTALQALLIAIVLSCFQRLWNEPAAMLSLNAVDGLDCRRH